MSFTLPLAIYDDFALSKGGDIASITDYGTATSTDRRFSNAM